MRSDVPSPADFEKRVKMHMPASIVPVLTTGEHRLGLPGPFDAFDRPARTGFCHDQRNATALSWPRAQEVDHERPTGRERTV
jgi:hypothetical protein